MSDVVVDIRVYVDWERTGTFDGVYDDITPYVMDARWQIGSRTPYFDVADAGRATIQVNNETGFFTPENADSPVVSYLVPLRPLRIDLVYESQSETMFYGYLKTARRPFSLTTENTFELVAEDLFAFLKEADFSIGLLESVRTDEVVQTIIEQVQLPPAIGSAWVIGIPGSSEIGETTVIGDASVGFDLDTGTVSVPYAGDNWTQETKALAAIADAVRAERGRFFFSRDGKAVFRNRSSLQTGTVTSKNYSKVSRASYDYWDQMKNEVIVVARPRKSEADATLYSIDNDIEIADGETLTVRALFTEPDSGVDISGKDLVKPNTGDGSLVVSGGSVTINMEAKAQSAELAITASGDVTVTTLDIKGTKLTSHRPQEATAVDGESIGRYGRQTLRVDAKMLADIEQAQNIADYELSRRKTPRGQYRMIGHSGTQAAESIGVGMLETVGVTAMPHTDDVGRVVGEVHNWKRNGWQYEYQMYLEDTDLTSYWTVGVKGSSEIGETTRVAF